MANQKLSKLVLPGSETVYEIDAVYFGGRSAEEWMSSTMSFKGTVSKSGTSSTITFATSDGGKVYMPTEIDGTPIKYVTGDAYKVVFNPTSDIADMYESSSAISSGSTSFAVSHGDMIIYTAGDKWVLIPSGNDEQVGTLTSITAGSGLTGGTMTSTGTIAVDWKEVACTDHTHGYEATGSISSTNTTVTVNPVSIEASYTPTGTVGITLTEREGGNFTPKGTINAGFSGTEMDTSVSFTADLSPSTAVYTPAGTVSQPEFTGTQGDISVSGTTTGSLKNLAFAGTEATITMADGVKDVSIGQHSTTPTGKVTVPAPVVDKTTDTFVKSVTVEDGTAPSVASWGSFTHDYTAGTQLLTISFGNGTFNAGKHTKVTVGDTASAITSVTPKAIGDVALTINPISFDHDVDLTKSISATYTPAGTVSGAFQGAAMTATGTYTPAGTVSQPTFSSTQRQTVLTDVSANAQTVKTAKFTPAGTVTATFAGKTVDVVGSFSGTAGTATQTVTPTASVSGTVSVSGTTTDATNCSKHG